MRRPTADSEESLFLDSFDGAVVNAGAAVDTDISVDDKLLFALGNSLNGAILGAGATLDASIGDFVSHDVSSIC